MATVTPAEARDSIRHYLLKGRVGRAADGAKFLLHAARGKGPIAMTALGGFLTASLAQKGIAHVTRRGMDRYEKEDVVESIPIPGLAIDIEKGSSDKTAIAVSKHQMAAGSLGRGEAQTSPAELHPSEFSLTGNLHSSTVMALKRRLARKQSPFVHADRENTSVSPQ